ncbi:phosphate-import protein PhnD precursor [mine drainage metagenome]|uniref:Phosphate-import protein PhnD n=1 Tax=mine drainage metagenome TaxID=410659 RepID=A0A1J5R316_9ZZZZ
MRSAGARRRIDELRRAIGVTLLAAWLAAPSSAAAAPACYTVAVVPQFAPAQIYARWRPLLDAVQRRTGLCLKLLAYASIPEFERAFTDGVPDFAFLNPYHVVMAHRSRGYAPLLHDARKLSGILVVRADGPIHQLRQLDGRTVAFPAPNAFGASLYLRALLQRQGLHIDADYVGSHDNVYRAVARGDVAAGGGVAATLARQPAALRALLRVIYATPQTAPHALAAAPRVAPAVRRQLRDAWLAMAGNAADAALLAGVQMPHPVVADYARDYAPLSRLRLDAFVVRPR